MQVKTEGIVIQTLRYTDTSLIVKIFTLDHGLVSFMVKGTRGKKSATKAVLFQPLNLLQLDLLLHENRNLQTLKEVKLMLNPIGIQRDMHKTSVVIFLAELLQKLLKESYVNPGLFDLLKQRIIEFNNEPFQPNFHLNLLLSVAEELGFSPINNYSEKEPLFSIEEGKFVGENIPATLGFILDEKISRQLHQLLNNHDFKLDRLNRRELLNELLKYFQYHNPGMSGIKSTAVLQELF